jgi:hypothetical protein
MRFDPAKVLPLIRQVAVGVDPEAAAQFDTAMAQAGAMLGGDIQNNLWPPWAANGFCTPTAT